MRNIATPKNENKEMIVVYNSNQDTLYISKGRQTYASIDIDDFILDFDKRGFLVGIEIDDVSKNLKVAKEYLSQIKEVRMSVTYKPSFLKIILVMKFKNIPEKVINLPFSVDLGHKRTSNVEMSFVPQK